MPVLSRSRLLEALTRVTDEWLGQLRTEGIAAAGAVAGGVATKFGLPSSVGVSFGSACAAVLITSLLARIHGPWWHGAARDDQGTLAEPYVDVTRELAENVEDAARSTKYEDRRDRERQALDRAGAVACDRLSKRCDCNAELFLFTRCPNAFEALGLWDGPLAVPRGAFLDRVWDGLDPVSLRGDKFRALAEYLDDLSTLARRGAVELVAQRVRGAEGRCVGMAVLIVDRSNAITSDEIHLLRSIAHEITMSNWIEAADSEDDCVA